MTFNLCTMNVLKRIVLLLILFFPMLLNANQQDEGWELKAIEYSGSFKTKTYYLDRILKPITVGEIYTDTLSLKDQAYDQLKSSDLFNDIQIGIESLEDGIILQIGIWERFPIIPEGSLSFADRNINVWMKEKNFALNRVNIGLGAVHHNFLGTLQNLGVFVQVGYTPQLKLKYFNPYIDAQKKHGLGLELSYAVNKELAVETKDFKQVFYKNNDQVLWTNQSLALIYQYKPAHKFQLEANLSLDRNIYDASIFEHYPRFLRAHKTEQWSLIPSFSLRYNEVDYWNYPLKGWRAVVGSSLHIPLNGQDFYFPIHQQFDFYLPLSKKWYYALIQRSKFNIIQAPYYVYQNNLGYDYHYLRGLESYVLDGKGFILLRQNIKYELLDWEYHLGWKYFEKIPLKLYPKFYVDLGYYIPNQHYSTQIMTNRQLYSFGIGLDILTLYALKFRIEYSFNNLGLFDLNFHRSGE